MAKIEASATNNSASSAANAKKLKNQLIAEEIANGHGYQKHVIEKKEFIDLDIHTSQQYQEHIENVISNPSGVRYYLDGRTVYLDETSRTVVIRNSNANAEGTAFRPSNWEEYLAKLPKREIPY